MPLTAPPPPSIPVKVLPSVAGTSRKRAVPHLHVSPMTYITFVLVALLSWTHVFAGNDVICAGDKNLRLIEGRWVQRSFIDTLVRKRSWAEAIIRVDSSVASLRIESGEISFNLSWHEGETGENHCVRVNSDGLWARPSWQTDKWFGPYLRVGPPSTDESAYYLGKYFIGCFNSETHERWCLSPSTISINGKEIPGRFQIDTSEGPGYGTGFLVKGRRLPFLVFVPRPDGWAVYEDDWASSEDRKPVDPVKGKPWRRLKQ